MSGPMTEDRLLQATTAACLHDVLDWDSVYAYNCPDDVTGAWTVATPAQRELLRRRRPKPQQFVAGMAGPGHDLIRVWPLPVEHPWFGDESHA